MPNRLDYQHFKNVVTHLYPEGSQRFSLGHDPVDEHLTSCIIMMDGEKPVGRFALYENPALQFEGQAAACIGSYECAESIQAATQLLEMATQMAVEKGYTWLIGPMEGSTWNNYRFSLNNDFPNFFMEPYHHTYYVDQFKNNNFQQIGDYVSYIDRTLDVDTGRLKKFEEYYKAKGAQFRNLNMTRFDKELEKIAVFSLEAFSENWLFTPISVEAFVAKYQKLKSFFNPDLVWIVEDETEEMQAFVFAIHNYNDPNGKSIIVKSLARKPDSPFRGIASYLAGKLIDLAKTQGYQEVIHAFMKEDNSSVNTSENYAVESYKEYGLFAKKIQ